MNLGEKYIMETFYHSLRKLLSFHLLSSMPDDIKINNFASCVYECEKCPLGRPRKRWKIIKTNLRVTPRSWVNLFTIITRLWAGRKCSIPGRGK